MVCLQMRNFEKLGMSREQAERLTIDVTEILCINKEKIAAQFVSKSTLEKVGHCTYFSSLQCMMSFAAAELRQHNNEDNVSD